MAVSETATRLGLDNTPGPTVTANLKLGTAFMETIRTLFGDESIGAHSGYRAPAVNKAVGNVTTSVRCLGLAFDFVCPNSELFTRSHWQF